MKKYLAAAIFLLVILLTFVVYSQSSKPNQAETRPAIQQQATTKIGRIGEGYFNFEIADENDERVQGLSGKDPLAETEALLFVFDRNDIHCFWMKDMKFNIDILWFDENKKLVYEKRNVSPDSYPANFCPNVPTKYVVEVGAGVAEKNYIKLGDVLDIEL